MKTIAERIAELRASREMSQAALAYRVGVSRVAVTKWESGQTQNLKLANLIELCRVFGITADDLLRGELRYSQHPAPSQAAHLSEDLTPKAYCQNNVFPEKLRDAYLSLTDDGRQMVIVQLDVAIETARRLHGTRPGSSKTAA